MNNNYKYNEVMVRFYDAVYENMPAIKDKSYYVNKLVNAGGPALEIGCGTGRIFCEALKQGADVYGIDMSELMLGKLKEKIDASEHYRVQLADAGEFKIDKKFNLIIAPFRMFQHLYTVEEQLKVLKNVKMHLAEGGMFIFDVFNPDLTRIITGEPETLQFSGEYSSGKALRRFHKVEPDLLHQMQYVTFRFEWDEDSEIKQAEFHTPLRYFFRYELEHLIARSGLKLVNIYGDLKNGPFSEKSHSMVVECKK